MNASVWYGIEISAISLNLDFTDLHTCINMTGLSYRLLLRILQLAFVCLLMTNIVTVDAFECGQPDGPCGKDVPAGVECPKGAGWCAAGHYCAYILGLSKSKCIELPKNCGTVGNKCCPSNAKTPHTNTTDPLKRLPFCTDGSTCVYDPEDLALRKDVYGGSSDGYVCATIPTNCGSPNGSCCPNTNFAGFNPPPNKPVCPEGYFCTYNMKNSTGDFPGSAFVSPGSVCSRNAPDCGEVGRPCCIDNSGNDTVSVCEPGSGRKGYCVGDDDYGSTKGVEDKDLICQLCPRAVCPKSG